MSNDPKTTFLKVFCDFRVIAAKILPYTDDFSYINQSILLWGGFGIFRKPWTIRS